MWLPIRLCREPLWGVPSADIGRPYISSHGPQNQMTQWPYTLFVRPQRVGTSGKSEKTHNTETTPYRYHNSNTATAHAEQSGWNKHQVAPSGYSRFCSFQVWAIVLLFLLLSHLTYIDFIHNSCYGIKPPNCIHKFIEGSPYLLEKKLWQHSLLPKLAELFFILCGTRMYSFMTRPNWKHSLLQSLSPQSIS